MSAASSAHVMPTLIDCRPSTTARITLVASLVMPTMVRGFRPEQNVPCAENDGTTPSSSRSGRPETTPHIQVSSNFTIVA